MNNTIQRTIIFLYAVIAIAASTVAAKDPNQPLNPFMKFQAAGIRLPSENQSPARLPPAYMTGVASAIEKPPLFIETVVVKFLDAQNLKAVAENMLSPFGAIAVDSASNSIVICDAEAPLRRMVDAIRKVDKTPKLLQIEVVILDVQLDDDTELGINWDMLSDKNHTVGFRQNYTQRIGSTAENADTIGNATAFNSTGLGSDLSIISGSIRNVVHLLQAKKKVEILASPTVLLVSGKTASVEAIEEIPYQEKTDSSLGGGFASTQFKLVGVKLNVSAILTDDNDILLTVEPEQNSNTGVFGASDVPIIDTRKAKSNLLLKDSEVVIMGGLRRKEATKIREQVPILGNIPLIGLLFGKTKTKIINSELLVFISPHIYNGQPLSPENLKKINYARNLKGVPMFDPNDAPRSKK